MRELTMFNEKYSKQNKMTEAGIAGQEEAMRWLTKTYPFLFNKKNPKILAKRIFNELKLLKPKKVSNNDLSRALYYYTHSRLYLIACLKQYYRYALDGKLDEKITVDEKAYALETLNKMHPKKSKPFANSVKTSRPIYRSGADSKVS
jgi:sRNA-binding protein